VLPLDDAFSTGVSKVYADDVDPDDYVGSANAHRRHLTPEGKQHALEDVRTAKDKRAAIEDALKANPHLSDRQIAERQNCDNKTVAAVRARLEDREEIPHVEVRTDSKGRQQPAGKPPKATPGQTMIPVEQRLAQNAADEALINVADAEVPSEPSAETVSDDSAKPSPPAPRLGEPDPLSRHPSLRSPSRRPTPSVSPPKRTTSADIMTAWLYAPVEERGRFVMNVGKEVLAHFPDDWVPAVEAWLASKQTPRVLN
jgi:hypothetical protein